MGRFTCIPGVIIMALNLSKPVWGLGAINMQIRVMQDSDCLRKPCRADRQGDQWS